MIAGNCRVLFAIARILAALDTVLEISAIHELRENVPVPVPCDRILRVRIEIAHGARRDAVGVGVDLVDAINDCPPESVGAYFVVSGIPGRPVKIHQTGNRVGIVEQIIEPVRDNSLVAGFANGTQRVGIDTIGTWLVC